MATLDSVFVFVDSDVLFPGASMKAQPRVGSDHTPLVLDTGAAKSSNPKMFRFEKWWLSQPGFHQMFVKPGRLLLPLQN